MKNFDDLEKNNGRFTFEQVAEQFGILQTRSQYIPGRIYSLTLQSPVPNLTEEIISNINFGREYYDLNPIGLNLFNENFKQISVFLNFKVIPPNVLSKLLEAFWYFSNQNGLQTLYKSDGTLLDLKERTLLDKRFYFVPSTILSNLLGLESLNYAINKYDNDLITNSKLIDWDHTGMLVNPSISSRGLYPENVNIRNLYESFIQSSITKF